MATPTVSADSSPDDAPDDRVVANYGSTALIRSTGTVAGLHGIDPFESTAIAATMAAGAELVVRWCDHIDAALVLGSRQPDTIVDPLAVAAARLGVVRRRSGGGAVLVSPGDLVWVDLLAAPQRLPDDVRTSMIQAGRVWADALTEIGLDRDVAVHEDGLTGGPWADLVCFAGLGPGELYRGDNKLVGLSQRRTRRGVRISGAIHRRDLVEQTGALMATPPVGAPHRALTAGEAGVAGASAEVIANALAARVAVGHP